MAPNTPGGSQIGASSKIQNLPVRNPDRMQPTHRSHDVACQHPVMRRSTKSRPLPRSLKIPHAAVSGSGHAPLLFRRLGFGCIHDMREHQRHQLPLECVHEEEGGRDLRREEATNRRGERVMMPQAMRGRRARLDVIRGAWRRSGRIQSPLRHATSTPHRRRAHAPAQCGR